MASNEDAATPAKGHGADTEVVSMELPAPAGWIKKFTPRKGVTPKRNEIVFTSPTGEEITNKRQLDQYLRSHPGGPPSSEFDWGTGDTPRRSARLGAKTKASETPEDEKPKKKERKSTSKKGHKGKSGGAENEAPEDAKDAAATKESADLEMALEDAKDAANEAPEDAKDAAATKESADLEMADEDTKDASNEAPEDAKDAAATRESADLEMAEEDTKDASNEAPEDAKDAAAAKESADLEMADAEEHGKKTEEGAAATVDQGVIEKKSEDKTMEDIEVKTEELNKEGPEEAGKADTSLLEAWNETKEVEAKEDSNNLPPVTEAIGDANAVELNKEGPEEAGKAGTSLLEAWNGTKEVEAKEDSNNLPPVTEAIGDENAVELNKEGPEEAGKADTSLLEAWNGTKEVEAKEDLNNLPPVTEAIGDENAVKNLEDSGMMRPSEEKENGKGNDEHSEDSVVLPRTSEVHKEAVAEKDVKDGDVLPKNDSHIGVQDGTASKEAPKITCEEGQHQPKASAVNC